MRQYECVCLKCGAKTQIAFHAEPHPELEEVFIRECKQCEKETKFVRVLTKKAASELRRKNEEQTLRDAITAKCAEYGFSCRFLYQSVIITTPLSDWRFDYHRSRITLYHESTTKINFKTGNYAFAHKQFEERKIKPIEVIEYIAGHDTGGKNGAV